jgi:hypothetical protein
MADKVSGIVDGTRLLVDLQQVDSIVKKFSGCLEPTEIAQQVTAGLVEKFGCVFARIWLMEPMVLPSNWWHQQGYISAPMAFLLGWQ